jgi:hypothetical protein
MVSAPGDDDSEARRQESLQAVIRQLLLFGEFSAKPMGTEAFEDPERQRRFLHFLYGAARSLGRHSFLAEPLSDDDVVNALGNALMTFEGATRELVTSTLMEIYQNRDGALVRLQQEGREAAEEWDWGARPDAVRRFSELEVGRSL